MRRQLSIPLSHHHSRVCPLVHDTIAETNWRSAVVDGTVVVGWVGLMREEEGGEAGDKEQSWTRMGFTRPRLFDVLPYFSLLPTASMGGAEWSGVAR